MKIQTVIFDLDNTIYAESAYFQEIFKQFCSNNSIKIETFQFLFDEFDHFRFTKKDIFKFALEEAGLFSNTFHNELFHLFTNISCVLQPYGGVDDWFNVCISKNIQIGILTNGIIKAQHNKWNCLNIENKDLIYFSPAREFEKDKPNLETFEKFMNQLNANWVNTVFVGDRFQNDIEVGLNKGSMGIQIGDEQIHESVPVFETMGLAFNYFSSTLVNN